METQSKTCGLELNGKGHWRSNPVFQIHISFSMDYYPFIVTQNKRISAKRE